MLLVMTSGCRSGPMTNRTSGTVWSRRQYGACRLALGRPGCEFMKASSSTSRLRRCSIRCRARSDLSTVSRHTLGAAQVHGHGLVTPPVLGAVQWEFMALRTVYEMACFLVSFEGYVPVNMQYKSQLRTDDSGCALPSVHRQSWTFLFCFHSAYCADDRRVFQVLLLDRLLTSCCCAAPHAQPSGVKVVHIPIVAQRMSPWSWLFRKPRDSPVAVH